VLVCSAPWVALWFHGVMSGMLGLFLCELNFEHLVAEGACFEAEKYPIYWNIKQFFT
jgi:hypothetical protein